MHDVLKRDKKKAILQIMWCCMDVGRQNVEFFLSHYRKICSFMHEHLTFSANSPSKGVGEGGICPLQACGCLRAKVSF
jgi:hypothetical protein